MKIKRNVVFFKESGNNILSAPLDPIKVYCGFNVYQETGK